MNSRETFPSGPALYLESHECQWFYTLCRRGLGDTAAARLPHPTDTEIAWLMERLAEYEILRQRWEEQAGVRPPDPDEESPF